MIHSQDLIVAETVNEAIGMTPSRPKRIGKRGSRKKYQDVTCTLDIETTNTKDDGFMYAIQTNIGGQNILLRYAEDWMEYMSWLLKKWRVDSDNVIVLYIQNLGYEFWYLGQILQDVWGEPLNQLFVNSHKPLVIRYPNGVEIRDSMRLFQKSLAKATKGCKHEKLVGDLDYSVYRTPDTPLTQKEIDYCVNDVQGLYEAIERLKSDGGYNQATIPITNTAMVIEAVNKEIRKDNQVFRAERKLMLDKKSLEVAYKCMAGGDTHGCRWKAGKTYENCNSYDLKSAHPSQMLLRDFPKGKPVYMEAVEEIDLNELIENHHGWCAKLYITDPCILPECPDPMISISKCPSIEEKGGTDNGRLLSADAICVYMDSNDWQRFREGYTYGEVIGAEVVAFSLGPLPKSFRNAILKFFRDKENLKGAGWVYDFAKICINTIFGACAQKVIRDEYDVSIEDLIEVSKTSWEDNLKDMEPAAVLDKQKKKFPFLWGLWTASLSRLMLWKLLKAVGWERVIYWDTDSAKYEGEPIKEVEVYNEEVRKTCRDREAVVTNKKGEEVFIGVAENEYPDVIYGYKKFRFLHAKCYAAELSDGTIVTTIAGVSKKNGAEAMNGDIDTLAPGLYIPDAGGNKLHYNSRPLTTRTDFNRYTRTASFIYMEPRDYSIEDTIPNFLEIREDEVCVI